MTCFPIPPLARLMKDLFFVILILPLALLNEESQKNTGYGIPRRGSSRYIFCKHNAILSCNRFSFFEEETTAFRVRFLRKHNAFFRVIAFLFPKKEQLLSESVFPSSGIILFRELRLSHAGLS